MLLEQETLGMHATVEQEDPLHTCGKTSVLHTTNENGFSQYNESELCPLGVKLKKTPSQLELYKAEFCKASNVVQNKKDAKPRGRPRGQAQASEPVAKKTKLNASNFSAQLLRIGKWEYAGKNDIDLVAKFYFATRKIIWEVLEGGRKKKIEFKWENIVGLKAHCPVNKPSTLTIKLNRKPLFFQETDPKAGKHTVWLKIEDFTGGEAEICWEHYLLCAPGELNIHYKKLMNCDARLKLLSQQAFNNSSSDGKESNGYLDKGIRNFFEQERCDGNDGFTPSCNPTPENESVGMSKVDSSKTLANLLQTIENEKI